MISRSTIIFALVVVELAILGMAAKAVSSGATWGPHMSFAGPAWVFRHRHRTPIETPPIEKTFQTGAIPHVVLDVDSTDVKIEGADVGAVHVAGEQRIYSREGSVRATLTAVQTVDGVQVSAESGITNDDFERSVVITVPRGARVEIAHARAVSVTGLAAKLVVRVDNHDVRIADHHGDLDVQTGDGAIVVTNAQGGTFSLHTDNGSLKLASSGADHLDAGTDSGSISAGGLRVVDGSIKSDSGSIKVIFASDSDAAVNLQSDSGSIHGAGGGDDTSHSLQLGSGRGRFQISTDSGSIHVTPGASSHV
jgi:hypothetical protein